uniref:DUF4371 domain-containing protein n=1 Tax=Amphimedon queenslandica TaxID=400682 RepID=A0A1X7V5W9_AMPQE
MENVREDPLDMRQIHLDVMCFPTWLRHDIQNSLISLLADEVRAMIKKEVQSAQFYTVMANETKEIIFLQKLFAATNNLSHLLELEVNHYAATDSCNSATKSTLNNLRSDKECDAIWKVAVTLAEKCDMPVSPPRSTRKRRLPRQIEESFLITTLLQQIENVL